jgi:hypothetical protein
MTALAVACGSCGGDDSHGGGPGPGDASTGDGSQGAPDAAHPPPPPPPALDASLDTNPGLDAPACNTAFWSIVDGNPRGLVVAPAPAAANQPHTASFGGKLYVAWDETSKDAQGNYTVRRAHVSVYNGNDAAPAWASVDGALGTGSYGNPYLAVASGKLYLAYLEIGSATVTLHVAVYGGNDATPAWTTVDGTSLPNMQEPHLVESSAKLYVVGSVPITGNSYTRVAVYNGNDAAPSWQIVDGAGVDGGLGQGVGVGLLPRALDVGGKLYAFRLLEYSGESYVKAAVYGGNDASPTWTDVSGPTGQINDDVFHLYAWPAFATVSGKIYAMWVDTPPNVAPKYRVSVYGGDDAHPQWLAVDGGALPAVPSTRPTNGGGPALGVLGTTLHAIWVQNGSVETAIYNGNDVAPAWGLDIGPCVTELNYSSASWAVAYQPELVENAGKLYGTWSETADSMSQSYSVRVAVHQ